MTVNLEALARVLGERLIRRGWTLTCAESCTAGGVAYAVTTAPGSSAWFERGFVTYSNAAKVDMLAVPPALIEEHGAVSEPVVRAMAEGALRASGADLAVAISGIAGPDGGTPDKPVGTVWFAWAGGGRVQARCEYLAGDRAAVRTQSVVIALRGLLNFVRTTV